MKSEPSKILEMLRSSNSESRLLGRELMKSLKLEQEILSLAFSSENFIWVEGGAL